MCFRDVKKRNLYIDIETFSTCDLATCGVYKYVEDGEFEILLIGYRYDNEPVKIIDLVSGDSIPKSFYDDLLDDDVIKHSFNANFEIVCLRTFLGIDIKESQWRCTAVTSSIMGLPNSLEESAMLLKLDINKMEEGKSLIKYFSMPCKPTVLNGWRTRNFPHHNPEKWSLFKEYCARDVMVEQAIANILSQFNIPERERELWLLDQIINNRGVKLDRKLIENAIECNNIYMDTLEKEFITLTKINNVESTLKLRQWLDSEHNIKVDTLNKDKVEELIKQCYGIVKRVLEIRQQISKTSIKKYEAMLRAMGKDERGRGFLQFYGANRTGRWAGRLVQIHNLPQSNLDNLEIAREYLLSGDYKKLEDIYGNVPQVLFKLIRTAFVPKEGCKFIVLDFNAIEARVLSWLARESWRMDVFKTHGKIYEASASKMFKVPMESITKDSEFRQKGKIAELALGYQGGIGALKTMGASNMGIEEQDLYNIVSSWRDSNRKIVELWNNVEQCAIKAVRDNIPVYLDRGISFNVSGGVLLVTLPSGRSLSYVNPSIDIHHTYNKYVLTYCGVNQETKKWGNISTYGGKLVENIVQAIARDCLGEAMLNLEKNGYEIVMHVHDEVVLEVPKESDDMDIVKSIMEREIPWAKGLDIRVKGFYSEFYKK